MNFCVVHVSCACAIVVRRVESVRMKKMEAIDEEGLVVVEIGRAHV